MTLPRVSTILKAVGLAPDFSAVPADALARAAARGTAVHALIEADHYGYLGDVPAELAGYLDGYRKFVAESGHKPVLSEATVTHPTWGYVGHLDRLGWLMDRRAILDWKCVATLAPTTAYQLAAYRLAWMAEHPAEPVDIIAAVQLRADGTYKLREYAVDEAEPVWLAALTVYCAQQR